MKWIFVMLTALALFAAPAFAASVKTYQVTGPVVDVTADTITVLKGKDNWEIAKDASTQITGDVKKGEKVTVMYRMTATSVAVKAPTAAKKKK